MNRRYLSAIRLSVKKDETTSPERQDEANRARITLLQGEHVGTASDLNVSASKVEPFSRPQLGEWLRNRSEEFDGIVWWRWDRAIRSMKDLMVLIDWAQENQKQLVFCEGLGSDIDFDFTNGKGQRRGSMGTMVASLIAWAAEVESQNVSDRVTGAQAYMRERGEWGGGMVPYGFEPVRIPGKDRGWTLVHSPETIDTLRQIIDWVHKKKTLLWIANKLNTDGVPSPRDAWDLIKQRRRAEAGVPESDEKKRPSSPRLWNTNGLKIILSSRALLGETEYEGRPVLDDEDKPVRRAVPVLGMIEFQEIQAWLAERSMGTKVRYEDPNPLLGIAYCARCGERYYMKQEVQKDRTYTSLSCRSRHGGGRESCGQPTLSMTYAVHAVSEVALTIIGNEPQQIRRYRPGSDRSDELAMWKERIDYLKEDWDDGTFTDRAEYKSRLRGYNDKIAEIGNEPVTESRYEYTNTGKTYQEVWTDLEVDDRRQLLEDLGIRVYLGRGDSAAANLALTEFGQADQPSHRRTFVLDEVEVSRILNGVTDGRIKKDFRLWFLQDKPETVQDVLSSRR